MAKKVLLVLVLAVIAAGGVSAQSKGKTAAPAKASAKNAASVDIVPFVKSELVAPKKAGFGLALGYERLLKGNFALGARIEFVTANKMTFFGIDAHGRWYPLAASLEKLFLDAGFGYGGLFSSGASIGGLTFSLKTGWKLDVTPKLFLEPAIGYTLAKGTAGYGPSGLGIGFSIGTKF
jgi:hypothetical protein